MAHPEIYRRIGLVPEREAVYDFLTGREFVQAQRPAARAADADAAAGPAIGLVELRTRPTGRSITYSKGMRQRVKVAAALVHDPPSCSSTSRSTAWTPASGCT